MGVLTELGVLLVGTMELVAEMVGVIEGVMLGVVLVGGTGELERVVGVPDTVGVRLVMREGSMTCRRRTSFSRSSNQPACAMEVMASTASNDFCGLENMVMGLMAVRWKKKKRSR